MNDKYTLWEELVARTARFVARDFPEVEYEDLFQDVMLYVLSQPKLVDPTAFGMTTALNRFAKKKCWEYRTQALHLSVQYSYRPSDVRRILETMFLDEESRYTYVAEDMESFYEDDRLAANSDIKYAFDRLPLTFKQAIFLKYALKSEVDKDRMSRAIDRMVQVLNSYNKEYEHLGIGNRTIMSNATARHILNIQTNGEDWEGDGSF